MLLSLALGRRELLEPHGARRGREELAPLAKEVKADDPEARSAGRRARRAARDAPAAQAGGRAQGARRRRRVRNPARAQ